MTRLVDSNIHSAMRIVAEALQMDSLGKIKESYMHYLNSIFFITQVLLEDARSQKDLGIEDIIVNNTRKLIHLAQQCIDRLSSFSDKKSCTSPYSASPSQPRPPVKPTEPAAPKWPGLVVPIVTSPTASSRVNLSGPVEQACQQNQQLMSAYKARMSRLRPGDVRATNLSLTLQRKLAENMAIAKAREEALNKKITERHKRLEDQAARRFNVTSGMSVDEQERRKLYTEILDYEHENKWPQPWREKLRSNPEDQGLLQDLVKQILSEQDHPLTRILKKYQYLIYNKTSPLVKRYVHEIKDIHVPYCQPERKSERSASVSSDDMLQQLDKGSTGDYEEEESLPNSSSCQQDFTDAVSASKDDVNTALSLGEKLTQRITANTLSVREEAERYRLDEMDDLFDEIDEIQTSEDTSVNNSNVERTEDLNLVRELELEAFQRHLQNIMKDVHNYLEKLQSMFIVAYEELDTATGRDLCYASIEEPFFKPIWGYLLVLYRLGNLKKEVRLAQSITLHQHSKPCDLGIEGKFSLVSPTAESPPPYFRAVEELQKIIHCVCPLEKLECTVRVSHLICHCVEEYYSRQGSTQVPVIGADDLVPILSYVVIKSCLPQLISECHAMGEFIHEGYLMGEEGYCLATLQTALCYVSSLLDLDNQEN